MYICTYFEHICAHALNCTHFEIVCRYLHINALIIFTYLNKFAKISLTKNRFHQCFCLDSDWRLRSIFMAQVLFSVKKYINTFFFHSISHQIDHICPNKTGSLSVNLTMKALKHAVTIAGPCFTKVQQYP